MEQPNKCPHHRVLSIEETAKVEKMLEQLSVVVVNGFLTNHSRAYETAAGQRDMKTGKILNHQMEVCLFSIGAIPGMLREAETIYAELAEFVGADKVMKEKGWKP